MEILSCSQFLSVQLSNGMLTLMFIPNLFLCLILEEIFAVYLVSRTISNCQYFCRYISQSPQSAHWTGNMHFMYMISHSFFSSIFLCFNYSRHFCMILQPYKFFCFKPLCLYSKKMAKQDPNTFSPHYIKDSCL